MEATAVSVLEEKLKEKFGEGIITFGELDMPCATISTELVEEVVGFLYHDKDLKYRFLTTMCGLHYPHNAGAELGMMYQLHNLETNSKIRLKTFFPLENPVVPSLTKLFATANWMEREAFDFYGIRFSGHPNLKRILNVDEMEAFPMRKEFPLEDGTREDKDDTMFGR
ncbi:MAG: NADH-quinone oxidoreductase subunit C [Chitinophagales bacterium]|nr:NADH-quinone oxidoreductase subunit C [Chitinophagales bacterium]